MPSLNLPYPLFLLIALLAHTYDVYALGVDFTSPNAGATLPAGPISIKWQDAGGDPNMSQLNTYMLQLLVGGNTADDSQVLQTIRPADNSVANGGVEDEIPADVAQSIENGFYWMMTSNTTDGNQVINYSDRFTLISMNGTTEPMYLNAANAVAGDSSNVPEAQYNVISSPSTTASSTTSTQTSTSRPSGESSTSPKSSNMGTAAFAGLITGAILAVIGIISLAAWSLFIFRRIRRKREQKKADHMVTELRKSKLAFVDGKAELPASDSPVNGRESGRPKELSTERQRVEAAGSDNPAVEMPGDETVYELEGSLAVWEAAIGRRSAVYDPTL